MSDDEKKLSYRLKHFSKGDAATVGFWGAIGGMVYVVYWAGRNLISWLKEKIR